jgi:hypothetical protein
LQQNSIYGWFTEGFATADCRGPGDTRKAVMNLAEATETTRLHCVARLTGALAALVTTRPCRAPTRLSRTIMEMASLHAVGPQVVEPVIGSTPRIWFPASYEDMPLKA